MRALFTTLMFARGRVAAFAAAAGLALAAPAVAQTSLDQMAGQMIVVGFTGDSATDESVLAMTSAIGQGRIGGVMFLGTNVKSLGDVRAMNTAFLEAARAAQLPAPFITLDQEGGAVERLTNAVGFEEIPRAVVVAEQNSPSGAFQIYSRMARSVVQLGFTVNFGPVVDLNTNPNNQIIARYGRSFSPDPGTVISYADAFVFAHRQTGLLTALKHFPGHGSSTSDSHEGFVDITNTWSPAELDPYRYMIACDRADMIMVGHLHHDRYAPAGSDVPSSLSPQWVNGVLRGDLGFRGVVITDDLEMGAIRDHFTLEQTVLLAVRAGVDVLLFSNTAYRRASLGDEVRAILVAEAQRDPAFRAMIEASYNRILALKERIDG